MPSALQFSKLFHKSYLEWDSYESWEVSRAGSNFSFLQLRKARLEECEQQAEFSYG